MYQSFYKFTSKPFQLSPDSRFFYGSKCHQRAMAYLRYGIEQGEGFIVITGDIGTGKTTLVQNLFSSYASGDLISARIVTSQLESEDLLRMIAASFKLEFEGISKAGLLTIIEKFLRECAWSGKHVLVVIDEAQNIPKASLEELRMLLNFQEAGVCLLQTFLLGQREFLEMIRANDFEQLRQRVIASYHLESLDQEDTRRYIEHRLMLVGWDNDPVITDDAFEQIFIYSNGVPRRINLLCDRLLLYGALEELRVFDADTVKEVVNEMRDESITGGILGDSRQQEPAGSETQDLRSDFDKRLEALELRFSRLEKAIQLERAMLQRVLSRK